MAERHRTRARRSWLIFPASRPRMARKSAETAADTVIFDLEDAVPAHEKPDARRCLMRSLSEVDFGAKEVLVRVNPVEEADFELDCEALRGAAIDGVVVPKATTEEGVRRAAAAIDACDLREPAVHLAIESPKAVLRSFELCGASDRVASVSFGAGDYTSVTGGRYDGSSLAYPRSHLAVVASALEIDCMDFVFPALQDLEGLRSDAQEGANLGYTGKWAIHPSQVDVINDVYTPTPAEVAWARRLIAVLEEDGGGGAVLLDGAMVDRALLPRAERILTKAASA